MRRCPQCAATYTNDFEYCLSDGTTLKPREDDRAAAPQGSSLPPTNADSLLPKKPSRKVLVIVGLSAAFFIFGIITVVLIFAIYRSASYSTNSDVANMRRDPRPGDPTPRPRTVDEIRDDLTRGNIAFNKPGEMFLDESKEIQLRLSPTLPVEALKKLVTGPGEIQTREVSVSDEMEATLYGDNFTITNPTQRKLISQNGATEWDWDVTPTKAGRQKLHLTLNAIVTYKDSEKPLEIKTFHEFIEVNVTNTQRFYAFGTMIGSHLQWIVPSLLIPLALWLWNRRRKVSKSEDVEERPGAKTRKPRKATRKKTSN